MVFYLVVLSPNPRVGHLQHEKSRGIVDYGIASHLSVRDDGLKELIQEVLNQILEAQATEAVGAEKYERSEGRQEYRNG